MNQHLRDKRLSRQHNRSFRLRIKHTETAEQKREHMLARKFRSLNHERAILSDPEYCPFYDPRDCEDYRKAD